MSEARRTDAKGTGADAMDARAAHTTGTQAGAMGAAGTRPAGGAAAGDAQDAPRVPKRVAAVILNSLKGGVVPRIGLPYITVGRETEIQALLQDLELIREGGASFRFIVGRYGSGKSFLLQTIRTHAMGENFVVADADLSPERRLAGGQGQGLATYRELIRNLSTKTRPEGGALTLVLDRWARNLLLEAEDTDTTVEACFRAQTAPLEEMVHGFDFVRVLRLYLSATQDGDDGTRSLVAKWLRGEYRLKSEARAELGMTSIIDDESWYDYIKLLAQFLVGAGYDGLLVLIDELVNLSKIPNGVTRQNNYEKILTMYNDTLQGKAHHLGIIMGGTPAAIEDTRRGVFSYEALRSRLTQGRFASEGARDMLAPIIRLNPLTYEELLVLTEKLAQIHAGYYGYESAVTTDDLVAFLQIEYGRVGAETHLTPREVIRDFIELLDIAYQNPDKPVSELLRNSELIGRGGWETEGSQGGVAAGGGNSSQGSNPSGGGTDGNSGQSGGSAGSGDNPYAEFTI